MPPPVTQVDSNTSNSINQNPLPTDFNFSMDFICKLIPKEFNGNRYELGQFIANCNNANQLASENQKIPLLYFILSRISGRAKEQLAQQVFNDWSALKEKLKILYQDKKHYVQIMEDLNNCKQSSNESISDFYQKLETLNSRALSAAQEYTRDQTNIPGKIQTINEITLNRFVYHSLPHISQMLRWKDFENLNSAYTAALSEERALNIQKNYRQKFCNICKRNNHETSQCRNRIPQKPINTIQNSSKYTYNTNSNFQHKTHPTQSSNMHNKNNNNYNQNTLQNKFCNYCKKQGHLIHECRKRQFNNQHKTNSNTNTTPSSTLSTQNQVHLNYPQSPVNTALEDQISSLMVFQN